MKGKILVIVVALLLCGAIASAFFLMSKKKDVPLQDTIEQVLTRDDRAKGVIPTNVNITKESDRFARGTLVDDRDGVTKTFFSMKIGDVWRIVDVTTAPVSCERFARLGFPGAFISDCELSFSDAVTVAEIDATFAGFSLEGAQLSVIGFVTDVSSGTTGSLVTIESGGSATVVTIPDTVVTVGDLVVITVADLADTKQKAATDTAASGVYTVVKTVTIGSEDNGLVDTKEKQNELPQEKKETKPETPKVTGDSGATIYKINAPKTAPPQAYFLNEFDVNASFEDIQIDGSF
jgi:hypothetical protein